jgi:hypothetical protein
MEITVIPFKDRFAIADKDGNVLDDAQGYGYKTKQKAYAAASWKFKGGKEKKNEEDVKIIEWFNEMDKEKKILKTIDKVYEDNFKEFARGEYTDDDVVNHVEEKHGVVLPDFVIQRIKKGTLGDAFYKKNKK